MKGIKYLLLGIIFVLIGGFILVDVESYLGGFGEFLFFIIGITLGVIGLTSNE